MASNKEDEDDFVIIGAGLPRTGTATLKHVLQDIFGKPCYHMFEVKSNPHHVDFWTSALKGDKKDKKEWKTFLKDYGAGVDAPICLFYKELMEVYPNAKVILSVRDPEEWYKSVINTIVPSGKFRDTWGGYIFCHFINPKIKKFGPFTKACFVAFIGENWEAENKDDYLYHYHKHIEEVKRIVPEEKLLILDLQEGYAPLCKFLGIPIKEGSLPRINDKSAFRRQYIWNVKILTWGVIVGIPVLVGVCGGLINSYFKLI